jgi:hypothetical protein
MRFAFFNCKDLKYLNVYYSLKLDQCPIFSPSQKNVSIADGPNVRDFGVMFTTLMAVVKLSDGSLWVNSPVAVQFDTLERINQLGPVRYLVAATPRHLWRLEGWHTLFPEAQLCSSRTTLLTLKKLPLPLTGVLGDEPPQAWADDFDHLVFKGNALLSIFDLFARFVRCFSGWVAAFNKQNCTIIVRWTGLCRPFGTLVRLQNQ